MDCCALEIGRVQRTGLKSVTPSSYPKPRAVLARRCVLDRHLVLGVSLSVRYVQFVSRRAVLKRQRSDACLSRTGRISSTDRGAMSRSSNPRDPLPVTLSISMSST